MPQIESLLITGASGFVGQSILDYLSDLPPNQLPKRIGLTTRMQKVCTPFSLMKKTNVLNISCDLQKPWEFDFQATHVINLAADGSPKAYTAESAALFCQITENLANWCRTQVTPTVFHASSGACFGIVPLPLADLNENLPSVEILQQAGPKKKKEVFIQSRITAEELLRVAEREKVLDLRIGRLFSFIGRHLRLKPQYAISSFVKMAETKKQINLSGNPLTTRSYLGAQDMAAWIYKSLDSNLDSSILAIGSAKPVTMIELANFIAELSDSLVTIQNPMLEGDIYVANNHNTLDKLQVSETQNWQDLVLSYMGNANKGEK